MRIATVAYSMRIALCVEVRRGSVKGVESDSMLCQRKGSRFGVEKRRGASRSVEHGIEAASRHHGWISGGGSLAAQARLASWPAAAEDTLVGGEQTNLGRLRQAPWLYTQSPGLDALYVILRNTIRNTLRTLYAGSRRLDAGARRLDAPLERLHAPSA
jgi:hypothetical protein